MTNSRRQAIAIDGPVASGKTTIGRIVAQRLGYRFLDTGAMYRAVTWAALKEGLGLEDEASLTTLAESLQMRPVHHGDDDGLEVNGEDVSGHLRRLEVDRGVSLVSRASGVRRALVRQQRQIAEEALIVMVGRDIGTVVLPDAGVKVYLDAPLETRAGRRFREMETKGERPDYAQVVDDLKRRDRIDSERSESPLRPAEDAVRIDSDDLEVDEVAERILAIGGWD